MVERLNPRERKAFEAMSMCPHRFELLGNMGLGVGKSTLDGLVARGFAQQGISPRQPPLPGWAITDAGKQALYGSPST